MTVELKNEAHIKDVLHAARKVQDFLWGDADERGYDFELWKQMLAKRLTKIDRLDFSQPHAVVELRKRLLQTAAVAVAWLVALDEETEREPCYPSECDPDCPGPR